MSEQTVEGRLARLIRQHLLAEPRKWQHRNISKVGVIVPSGACLQLLDLADELSPEVRPAQAEPAMEPEPEAELVEETIEPEPADGDGGNGTEV